MLVTGGAKALCRGVTSRARGGDLRSVCHAKPQEPKGEAGLGLDWRLCLAGTGRSPDQVIWQGPQCCGLALTARPGGGRTCLGVDGGIAAVVETVARKAGRVLGLLMPRPQESPRASRGVRMGWPATLAAARSRVARGAPATGPMLFSR